MKSAPLAHKVDRRFKYDSSVATDIRKRFRKVRRQLNQAERAMREFDAATDQERRTA